MAHEIIPQHLSIEAMRSSGYRDTAHAVAELIDNSIQAGEGINDHTLVEVICIDKEDIVSQRRSRRIDKIAVYDNASGMDADTLRIALQFGNGTHLESNNQGGIGKFGMGLPNSSISQCRRVDVWSWQNGRCLYSYLDVDAIRQGKLQQVPEPQEDQFPLYWKKFIRDGIGPHGTLVVWSSLDRIKWKGSKAFLDNAEFLIGRIYRYFISERKATIRLYACQEDHSSIITHIDRDVLPNDPLGLMQNTLAPAPWDKNAPFDELGTQQIDVEYNGQTHAVLLRFSVCKREVRSEGGHAQIGKWAMKNQGVSVVRARRELELNKTFDISYDPRERWWGVEVAFAPALDDIFGVTNTKQAVTAFHNMDLEEDAAAEGLTPADYRQQLQDNEDPRLAIYMICLSIRRTLNTMRIQIQRMMEGSRRAEEEIAPPGSAEALATRATRQRIERLGRRGRSDEGESMEIKEREKELEEELVATGVPEKEAKGIAVTYVRNNIKFLFENTDFSGPAIFDIKSKAGTIIVTINTRHPASEHLFELLRNEEEPSTDPPALRGLKLLLTAWARMEDEAGEERRQFLEDTRIEWGQFARDFLKEFNE